MLVVGGCAVIGASLGVTFWRLSQSDLFKRMVSKKNKTGIEADEEFLEGAEDDGVEDAQVIASDASLADDPDESEESELEQNNIENQSVDPDILSEIEAANRDANNESENESEDFSVSFETEGDELDGAELDNDEDMPAEPLENSPAEVSDASGVAGSDLAARSLEFQEKTAIALTEIAERLGDALVRLERLESSVEAQFSGGGESVSASPSGLLDEDIEISELPIAPAPNEPVADESSDLEPQDITESGQKNAEIGDLGGSDGMDQDPDVTSAEDKVSSEFETVEETDDPDIIAEAGDEDGGFKEEQEDPLDLPRVIGI